MQMADRPITGVSPCQNSKQARSRTGADEVTAALDRTIAAVVGSSPVPCTEFVGKVWEYIKANNLQYSENKREILADDKLQAALEAKSNSMFEMNRYIARHLF
jgi:chromatin remodeling complex protein RSC6